MIHLIYTSLPLNQIPEDHQFKLENAIKNWGRNHSFYENDPSPNFHIRRVKDAKGNARFEWRRIFNRVLHIPSVLTECSLDNHGFSYWTKYVEFVAVATDVQFRKNGVTRFSAINPMEGHKSSIRERQDEDGLNRLELSIERFQEFRYVFTGFQDDIAWFQGYVVFFLETAAVYHLVEQAMQMSRGNLDSPVVAAMRKKLERIIKICNLNDVWTRNQEKE